MNQPPPTVRVFVAGASGSGKSAAAWTHYLARFPRRLLIDPTGEWEQPNTWHGAPLPPYPGADAVCYSVGQLDTALRKVAARGKWTITLGIGPDEFGELVPYLIPLSGDEGEAGGIARSPIYRCGGAALLNDEVDLVAPPRGLKVEVRTLYRRSRHAGLSIVSTTQRPEAVSREVSAQSHQVLCLHLVEPNGIAYMQNIMQTDLTHLWSWNRQHPHGGLWKDLRSGQTRWLTESGRLVEPQVPESAASRAPRAASPAPASDGPGDGDGAASAAPAGQPATDRRAAWVREDHQTETGEPEQRAAPRRQRR